MSTMMNETNPNFYPPGIGVWLHRGCVMDDGLCEVRIFARDEDVQGGKPYKIMDHACLMNGKNYPAWTYLIASHDQMLKNGWTFVTDDTNIDREVLRAIARLNR